MSIPVSQVMNEECFILKKLKSVYVVLFFSVVKEEIIDEEQRLPCFNGRVVSWVSELFY